MDAYGRYGAYGTYGTWGDSTIQETAAQAVLSDDSGGWLDWAQQGLPLVGAIVDATTDPYKKMQRLEAELAEARMKGKSLSTIRRLEADYAAAQRKVALKIEGEASTRVFRTLGWLGIGVAIVAGVAVSGAVVYSLVRK